MGLFGDSPPNLIHIRLAATHKLVFLVGVTIGLMVARFQFLSAAIDGALIATRGYEYDAENDCVVVRYWASLSLSLPERRKRDRN